jgi:hypothetical protein
MKSGKLHFGCCAAAALVAFSNSVPAWADVTISARATSDMSCAGGTCEPTGTKAVLNAADLENYIAAFGNLTVTTTGNGVEAENIIVEKGFASPGTSSLSLEAQGAIVVNAPVMIGPDGDVSELQLVSESGGELGAISFGPKGHVSFGSISDIFDINGAVFTLVGTLRDLAKDIASNSGGGFCVLTHDYDAAKDGAYHSSPISTTYTGYFEALGNSISNLKIDDASDEFVGLFADVDGGQGFGTVRNLKLENVSIKGGAHHAIGGIAGYFSGGAVLSQSSATGSIEGGESSTTGGLAGDVEGMIQSSWSGVNVTGGGEYAFIGGLAGDVNGTITNSYAAGAVGGGSAAFVGGLIGENGASVSGSFATGAVRAGGSSAVGGLIGVTLAAVTNCYATGSVSASSKVASDLGGLIGYAPVGASDSYAAGAVIGKGPVEIGGVVGYDGSRSGFSDTYWDLTTSGVAQGAGNILNDPGITGLTSNQLSSGLPRGFDKKVWRENANMNSGFPYLVANPPPK